MPTAIVSELSSLTGAPVAYLRPAVVSDVWVVRSVREDLANLQGSDLIICRLQRFPQDMHTIVKSRRCSGVKSLAIKALLGLPKYVACQSALCRCRPCRSGT